MIYTFLSFIINIIIIIFSIVEFDSKVYLNNLHLRPTLKLYLKFIDYCQYYLTKAYAHPPPYFKPFNNSPIFSQYHHHEHNPIKDLYQRQFNTSKIWILILSLIFFFGDLLVVVLLEIVCDDGIGIGMGMYVGCYERLMVLYVNIFI